MHFTVVSTNDTDQPTKENMWIQ